ncbi:MAG: hypothetical protein EP330_29820 [Deltaproteobacteria bacterium]|nr:MAG: hypothetical protein EP330_29820 [Deltaproteobacteria bacterium]
MLTRRTLLISSLASLAACGAPVPEPDATPTWRIRAAETLGRAAGWLWAAQSEHGHWRSEMYGPLRSGQSLTPFALEALTRVPTEAMGFPADKASAALGWMKNVRSADGALGLAGSSADYPVYASGLALAAAHRMNPDGVHRLTAPIATWLRGQQLLDGWEEHREHGGFPMGSTVRPTPPNPGHVDLSMSRRAIEGLREAGEPADSPAMQAALAFVKRHQRESGAFVYALEDGLNKGVRIDEEGSSDGYGSSTTDGLLALLALGVPEDDPDVKRAHAWLLEHHRTDENPAVGKAHARFGVAMRFYYRAGAARVFAALGGPKDWQLGLHDALKAEQREDGSFQSEFVLQKEDEPVIATGLAVIALAGCLGVR